MSAKIVKSTVVLTDKFSKEVEKFFEWATKMKYVIEDINDMEHEWSTRLLSKFEEPSRNKLENYIKKLFEHYSISVNKMSIGDAKLLAKEFKENGKKSNKPNVIEDVKLSVKKNKTSVIEDVTLDMSLDTSETFNVDTLDYWTSELVEVFGKPKKTGGDDVEHTWEWKIRVNDVTFTIYDWNENNDNFEDSTWYLGAMSDNKKNIKTLKTYIDSMNKIEDDIEDIEEKIDMNTLFGDFVLSDSDSDSDNDNEKV